MIPALIDIEAHIPPERLNQGRQLFTDGRVAVAGPGGSSRTVTPDPGRGLAGRLAPALARADLDTAPRVRPVPCLRLTTVEASMSGGGKDTYDFACLRFDYGGNHEPRWNEQDLDMLFQPLDA